MGKRLKIALAVLVVALVGVIAYRVAQPPDEPVYQGKPLSEWLNIHTPFQGASGIILTTLIAKRADAQQKADEAVRQCGTNAIPTLLRLLRTKDSAFETWTRRLLQRQHVIQIRFTPASYWNHVAAAGFAVLSTNAQAAVPDLIEIANQNISYWSACEAIYSLGCIGPPAKPAVPHLLQWTTNADEAVRQTAIRTLGKIGPSAKAAVPFLLQCATNDLAKQSLIQIDFEAAAKAGLINGGVNRP